MKRWSPLLGLAFGVCLLLTGCPDDKKGAKTAQVSGTVNLDGKPLAEGDITFAGDPGTAPDTLKVTNGAFQGAVKLGKKKVEVRAYKKEKPPPTATGGVQEVLVNYIPAKYNTETTLTAEVTDGGVNPSTFDVQSK